MASSKRSNVFVSYAHEDRAYLAEFQTHIAPEVRSEFIDLWDDTRLRGGENWRAEIQHALRVARIAVCLVSKYFLASEFIHMYELPLLLEASQRGEVTILPVIVGVCDYQRSPLNEIQAINPPSKPLAALDETERDSIWLKVKAQIENLLGSAKEPPTGEETNPGATVRAQILRQAISANERGQFQDSIQMLRPLAKADHFDYLLWFEYSYAWAHVDTDLAVAAFMRAFNNSDHRRTVLGINDVKFPPVLFRYSVITGRGLGTYSHGLGVQPDWIYLLDASGQHQSMQIRTDSSSHATSGAIVGDFSSVNVVYTARWIGVATIRNHDIDQARFKDEWEKANIRRGEIF